jgi:C-terminal processing protease CtpA/Prc
MDRRPHFPTLETRLQVKFVNVDPEGSSPLRIIHSASIRALIATTILLSCGLASSTVGQLSSYEREAGRQMLTMVRLDIEKNYYDPSFRGIDLGERFSQADERIKNAKSNGEIFGVIAQALLDFDDSHLFFIPPSRVARVEYGWQMQAIGDKCYVIAVKPGSDAEAKGLKRGDLILSIDNFTPTREVMWKMQYYYYTLRPKPGMRLVVQSPEGAPRQLDVLAKITQGTKQMSFGDMDLEIEAENEAHINRNRFFEKDNVIIWKMPGFDIYDANELANIMVRVKKHQTLILDLRGNGGGLVVMLKRLIGYFFEQDTKVSELKYRKEVKTEVADTKGNAVFKGKLIVLIDSRSASAAEIFSRVIQLEKRGIVLGDRSAGAVMQSRQYVHEVGLEYASIYGASVTNADVIMKDGKSLEHVGVTPDELLLPTSADLAANRDPVLSRAAQLAGLNLDPDAAGKLFPIEWRK